MSRLVADMLRDDRLTQVTAALMAVLVVSYGTLDIKARTILGLLAFLLVPIACWYGALPLRDGVPRRFWRTVASAFSLWWLFLVAHVWTAITATGSISDVLFSVAFGSLYLLLVAAIAGYADEALAGHRRGIDVLAQWPTAAILVTTLTAYFLVLPTIHAPGISTALPLKCLLITLDAYLTIQLIVLATAAGPVTWRTVHTLLAVVTGAWLIGDIGDAIHTYQGTGPKTFVGLRALWITSAVLAARIGATADREQLPAKHRDEVLDPRTPAHTVGAAIALPIVHVISWRLGLYPAHLREPQERLLLVAIVLLGVLAWFQYRMLSRVAEARVRERAEREETIQRRRVNLRLQRERERAEAAVQAIEDRFATVFRACPSPMVITRLEDGMVVDLNESFESATGWSRHACFGRTTTELGLWRDEVSRKRFAARIAKGEELRNRCMVLGKAPEDQREFLVDATRIDLEDGPGALTLARPLRSVDSIEGAPIALEDESALFAGIGPKGIICAWSRGMAELTGIARDDALGRPLVEVFGLPESGIADALTGAEDDGWCSLRLTVKRRMGGRERLAARWLAADRSTPDAGVLLLLEPPGSDGRETDGRKAGDRDG